MKIRSFIAFGLLAVLLLVSCAPAESPAPAEPQALPQLTEPAPPPTETEAPIVPTETPPTVAQPTETPSAEVPQPVATSRGDSLEATDPATVSLASGELQLVEFFRYT